MLVTDKYQDDVAIQLVVVLSLKTLSDLEILNQKSQIVIDYNILKQECEGCQKESLHRASLKFFLNWYIVIIISWLKIPIAQSRNWLSCRVAYGIGTRKHPSNEGKVSGEGVSSHGTFLIPHQFLNHIKNR